MFRRKGKEVEVIHGYALKYTLIAVEHIVCECVYILNPANIAETSEAVQHVN